MAQQTITKVDGPHPWTHKASGSVNNDFLLRFEGSEDKFCLTQKSAQGPQVGQVLDLEVVGPHPIREGFKKVKKPDTFQPNGQQSFGGVRSHDDPATRASIEKQVSLKAAVEYACGHSSPPAADVVVTTAQVFFDWLRNGQS